MTNGIHASMQAMKAARSQSDLDPVPTDSECHQLSSCHHAVLSISQLRDAVVCSTRLLQGVHRTPKCRRIGISPRSAGRPG